MPVTPEKSPSYELGYLYQMCAIYISAFLFIAIDSVALSMIMFGCAQLEIVMDKLEQVPWELNYLLDTRYWNCWRSEKVLIFLMR